jgi:hypothetical protein
MMHEKDIVNVNTALAEQFATDIETIWERLGTSYGKD